MVLASGSYSFHTIPSLLCKNIALPKLYSINFAVHLHADTAAFSLSPTFLHQDRGSNIKDWTMREQILVPGPFSLTSRTTHPPVRQWTLIFNGDVKNPPCCSEAILIGIWSTHYRSDASNTLTQVIISAVKCFGVFFLSWNIQTDREWAMSLFPNFSSQKTEQANFSFLP